MNYEVLADEIINGKKIDKETAEELINCPDAEVFSLAAAAHKIKTHFLGKKVRLCSIINAKSGSCSENCSFCAQSAHSNANSITYPLMNSNEIKNAAEKAKADKATAFSIVTSGKGVFSKNDMNTIEDSINRFSKLEIKSCASLGIMTVDQLKELKKAGLKRYHHNLETSKSFFKEMCSTHSYDDRIKTVKAAKEAGLEVCCGGIFGIGETPEQRVELAFNIKELDVESMPLNILTPIKGTKLENSSSLSPLEAIRLIATFRFINPTKEIGVIGGRESQMKELQTLVLISGANAILVGNYLTTNGRSAEFDIKMIKDLGLEIEEVNHE